MLDTLFRNIRNVEKDLVEHLLTLSSTGDRFQIPDKVYQLNDGGMGSIRFVDKTQAYFNDLIQVQYFDTDNIPVLITLTEANNNLYELDIWKVNYKKLKTYPTIDKIKIVT
jgi:hypothetical protein